MSTNTAPLFIVILAACALAQVGHADLKDKKRVIACPVMSGKVEIDKATKSHMYADYKGNRYFFCCGSCPPQFKKDPAKYASKPHIKTPKQKPRK